MENNSDTQDDGIFVEITDSIREDFIASFLIKTGDQKDVVRKNDLRANYVQWLVDEHGRYNRDIDNPEASKLHSLMRTILGEIPESVNANGHSVFVGIILAPLSERNITTASRAAEAFSDNLKSLYVRGYIDGFNDKPIDHEFIMMRGRDHLLGDAYRQGWADGKDDNTERDST